tara:strand:+ start:1010 stop:1417 length:408 start_codon:yes stop_codon:yes gene_type:complete
MALEQYSAVRSALESALDNISGLANHKEEPDAIPKVPFSILGNGEIDYSTDFGGGHNVLFKLFLAVHESTSASAFSSLDSYLASTGASSIKAAVNGATIGNGYAEVVRVENVGRVRYRERTFVGAEFIIGIQSGG